MPGVSVITFFCLTACRPLELVSYGAGNKKQHVRLSVFADITIMYTQYLLWLALFKILGHVMNRSIVSCVS